MFSGMKAGLLLGCALLGAPALRAQTLRTLAPGQLAERIVSTSDTTQAYAAYLPSRYNRARTWPVAFLMDPRGRALVPMARVQAVAERFGYVVLSSWNTLSDSATNVNVLAMNAMLGDAQAALRVDMHRLYLVGFSGTARLAWSFAQQLDGRVAGILGAGASGLEFVLQVAAPGVPRPAFYGTAGRVDFNYEEMQSFASWLRQQHMAHRIRYFNGGHEWPPDTLFEEAFAWFELQAMHNGQRVVDSVLIDSLRSADMNAARALEARQLGANALARWREIAADYEGDAALTAHQRLDALAADKSVRRALDRREKLHKQFIAFDRQLHTWLAAAADESHHVTAKDGAGQLGIERRLKTAADTADAEASLAAKRELEQAFVSLSFYAPHDALARHQPERALLLLELAEEIQPHTGRVALFRAYAFTLAGRTEDALQAVTQAIAEGVPPAALRSDPSLAALRADARFERLVAGGSRPQR